MHSTTQGRPGGVRRALVVVHEGPVGPVAQVAAAVAAGLRAAGLDVVVARPETTVDWTEVDLMVVGCPATALASRRALDTGLQHWLATVPEGTASGPTLATYETRLSRRGLRRGAATRTALGLCARGWRVASAPARFLLAADGTVGTAEVARATRWGHDLAGRDERYGPLHDGAAELRRRDLAPAAELAGSLP